LVECDFLSNPQVEMLLKTRTYQETIAQILLQGIHNYFQFLEQMITTDQAK
jgi:N-acetylmuramoyl-L-alanine amidase